MSTPWAALVSMVVLAAGGAAPTLVLVGRRWLAVPVAPLAGAVLAGAAAAGCLAIGGSVVAWFVGLAVLAAAVALAGWYRFRAGRNRFRAGRVGPPGGDPLGAPGPTTELDRSTERVGRWARPLGLVVAAGATGWGLVALRAPSIDFDARAIWLLRAAWIAAGHEVARATFSGAATSFAHPTYPPLISGSVALSWVVTGDHGYRLGQVVIALLNGCAVTVAALVAVEVGVRCSASVSVSAGASASASAGASARVSVSAGASLKPVAANDRPGWARTATVVPAVAGVAVAGLLVLVAFGVAGPFATNGYADLLWSSAAVGAVGFGLVLPGRGHDLGVAAVLLAVAGLTKDEGIAVGMVVVVFMTARAAWSEWRSGRPGGRAPREPGGRTVPWRPLVAGAAGVLALGAWPVLVRVLGPGTPLSPPAPVQSAALRARLTYDAMAAHLHVVLLALPVAAVGGLFLRAGRRAARLGNDGWAWLVLGAATAIIGGTYVVGRTDIQLLLLTSVHRTTFFPVLAAWWIVAVWAVVATSRVGRTTDVPAPLDGEPVAVLHHLP